MITRLCRGIVAAVVFLNKKELEALRRLLDTYLATDDSDPEIPRLKRIMDGLQGEGR